MLTPLFEAGYVQTKNKLVMVLRVNILILFRHVQQSQEKPGLMLLFNYNFTVTRMVMRGTTQYFTWNILFCPVKQNLHEMRCGIHTQVYMTHVILHDS